MSTDTAVLRATDRCDAPDCDAAARVRAHFIDGSLDFCGHHYTDYEASLAEVVVAIDDERLHR